jgi:hypothetical protein
MILGKPERTHGNLAPSSVAERVQGYAAERGRDRSYARQSVEGNGKTLGLGIQRRWRKNRN